MPWWGPNSELGWGGVGENVIVGLDVGLDVGLGVRFKVGNSVGLNVRMDISRADKNSDGVAV